MARTFNRDTIIQELKAGYEIIGNPLFGYEIKGGQYHEWNVRRDTLRKLLEQGLLSQDETREYNHILWHYKWEDKKGVNKMAKEGNYIERYLIAGMKFGIEDYKSPGKHWFPERHEKRFKCWVVGGGYGCGVGGFGSADTIRSARSLVRKYAVDRLQKYIIDVSPKLIEGMQALTELQKRPYTNSLIPFMAIKKARG